MRITKKVEKTIEVDGKYCGDIRLCDYCQSQGGWHCGYFMDKNKHEMPLSAKIEGKKFKVKRCPECIKEFGYGEKE